MNPWRSVLGSFCFVCIALSQQTALGGTLVVPPEFETTEAAGYSGAFGSAIRVQQVYDRSLMPTEAVSVTALRFRRDSSATVFSGATVPLEVSLSTTAKSPDGLSTTFEENLGSDKVVVFSGTATFSSNGPLGAGGAAPFEIELVLNSAFKYDPSKGNLLVDLRSPAAGSAPLMDSSNSTTDKSSRVFSFSPDAATATYSDSGADIIQIAYEVIPPEPPASWVVPAEFTNAEAPGYSGIFGSTMRLQEVYATTNLPGVPITISGLKFRRDANMSTFSESAAQLRVELSTTAKPVDGLSAEFADNVGADRLQVFSGAVAFTSTNPLGTNGSAPFELEIPFVSPFEYDPANGNLLIEIQSFIGGSGLWIDASGIPTDGASRAFSYSAEATAAQYVDTGADVVQLAYVETPTSKPKFSPKPGFFTNSVMLTMTSGLTNAEIRYTLDGTEPVMGSDLFQNSVVLTNTALVRARTFTNGAAASPIVEGLYLEQIWNDGIPAAWRQQHFGDAWWKLEGAAALADPDQDGVLNYHEWVLGTDPKSGSSLPTRPSEVTTYAGSTAGYQDGPRLEARFDGGVADMVLDPAGRLWVAEASAAGYTEPGSSGQRLRRIETDGTVVTIAGAEAGMVDGPAAEARFSILNAVALGNGGDVYVADRGNHRIRRLHAETVSTYAGSTSGYLDGEAASALFSAPMGVASDTAGNLYVADFMNLRIRKVSVDGLVTTYANAAGNRGLQNGDRLSASFDSPNDIAYGPDHALYVSDWSNHAIRKISESGEVTTFASGLAFYPERVSVDGQGRVYVGGSNLGVSWTYLQAFAPSGESLWVLTPLKGYQDGPIDQAKFEGMSRVCALGDGSLLVGDMYRVRKLTLAPVSLVSLTPAGGDFSGMVLVEVADVAPAAEARYTLDGSDPAAASPLVTSPLALTNSCTLKVRLFANGNPVSAVVTGAYHVTPLPPTITVSPVSQTVFEGADVKFSVRASGTPPFHYEWTHNGAPIPDSNAEDLLLPNVTLASAGEYAVTVFNGLGAAPTVLAQLTVSPLPRPPRIIEQPRTASAVVGGTAIFTVIATGDEPLTYSWRRNNGTIQAETTQPSLVLTNVQASQAGYYYVRITNPHGTITSQQAVLSVTANPVPLEYLYPAERLVNVGETVSVVVSASGTGPITYQWYFNGRAMPGFTNRTLYIPSATLAHAGTYRVRVSNPYESSLSAGLMVLVRDGAVGGTVSFSNQDSGAGIDAPVVDAASGARLGGADFLAQLYAGPTTDALQPVGAAMPFYDSALAGYIRPGPSAVRTIASVTPGQSAFVQIRVWECADAPTFDEAYAAGLRTGQSAVLTVTTGGAGEPPSLPAPLAGLTGFSVGREQEAPVVALLSPAAGATSDERVSLSGTVSDNARVAQAVWYWNEQPQGTLTLSQGTFQVTGLRLLRGDNTFRVVATDSAGNAGSATRVATWQPWRTLALGGSAAVQEGRRLTLPLELTSSGEVGGLSFVLRYETDWLKDPTFEWNTAIAGAAQALNLNTPGEVRGTLSLPGQTLTAGTVQIGEVSFRTRSVPAPQATAIRTEVTDIASGAGTQFAFGTDAQGASATITPRRFVGDNNANDRLDVGDATIVQRLVTLLDPVRAWDIPGNDLNGSADLDSGDVIRILRTVVDLDPQPEGSALGRQASASGRPGLSRHGPGDLNGLSRLTVARQSSAGSEQLKVQVRLENLTLPISGASFRLRYPAGWLQVRDNAAHQAGALVPSGANGVWRVGSSYQAQTGELAFAVSSATAWAGNSGVLAEVVFDLAPGVLPSTALALQLAQVEITSADGYDAVGLAGDAVALSSVLPITAGEVRPPHMTAAGFEFSVAGAPDNALRVEVSTDLIHWTPLTSVTLSGSVASVIDAEAGGAAQRFYRVLR